MTPISNNLFNQSKTNLWKGKKNLINFKRKKELNTKIDNLTYLIEKIIYTQKQQQTQTNKHGICEDGSYI